jgi:hypothetical protein
MSKFPSPRVSRRPAPFLPRLEALEDRSLPAPVTFSVLPGGFLRVASTTGNKHIAVFDNGTNGANNITVKVGPTLFMPGVPLSGVLVKTNGGHNTVNYVLTGSLAAGTPRSITVMLGAGPNQFSGHLQGSLTTRSSLTLVVSGGGGFNSISVNATSDIGPRAALTIEEFAGTGQANLSSRFTGSDAGALTVFEQGSPAADVLSQLNTLLPGSSGTLSAQELGGAGNDRFTLVDNRVSLFDNTTIAAAINGGLGFNTAFSTKDVTVSNASSTKV